MTTDQQGKDLPGYEKKSFLLYYNGGEIWFEHLECLYKNENLVLEKLGSDLQAILKPFSTSFICFVFFDTVVTENIFLAVKRLLLDSEKRFVKVAFCGIDRKNKRLFRKALSDHGFAMGFFEGLEDAKLWLLP